LFHRSRLGTGLLHITHLVAKRQRSVFSHVARLSVRGCSSQQALCCHVDASLGRPPHQSTGWSISVRSSAFPPPELICGVGPPSADMERCFRLRLDDDDDDDDDVSSRDILMKLFAPFIYLQDLLSVVSPAYCICMVQLNQHKHCAHKLGNCFLDVVTRCRCVFYATVYNVQLYIYNLPVLFVVH